jgi:DNA repair exonuclease SbcCD ATPase subunit
MGILTNWLLAEVHEKLDFIIQTQTEEVIRMSELGDALNAVSAQLDKAKTEIVTKIADLEAALATAGQIPADAQAVIDSLKAQAQALDDIVPDVPA